ncbi:cyanide hydratase [Apiospora kogelbergensis]|uniref:nitrilase n=1 Tax=Apiospora kogelbergensis TaxID=1337665 RepID=A0AAW0R1Q7_9PEZI
MAESNKTSLRVAVTQAEPVWLDLDATVDKTCALVEEAAANSAKLVSFPECWIPGYPAWIWDRNLDPDMVVAYTRNSLVLSSVQMDRIRNCAAQHQIVVVLGFSENRHDSLYISQAVIDADGEVRVARSKIKASHMERTVFGDASAECLQSVAETAAGRVGTLSCWEHCQPLLKYHTYAQREQIHVAAWPPALAHQGPELWSMSREGIENLSRTYAIESQSFVLHTTAVLGKSGIEKMRVQNSMLMATPGGGASAVFGPDGRKLTEDIPTTEEGIVYADLDFDEIIKSKSFLDLCGHYSRPDLLWLGVDKDMKTIVREK